MGIGFEVGIGEVRDLAREAMELENVRLFDLPEPGPCAPLVNAEERLQLIECRPMHVERIREQLPQRRIPARLVDCLSSRSSKCGVRDWWRWTTKRAVWRLRSTIC